MGRGTRSVLVLVLLLGAGIRLYGIGFGLPELYYWDEPTVVHRAVRFGGGDLNPHFFAYPTLYMYVLAGVLGALFAVGRLAGVYGSAQDFAVEYLTDPTAHYLTVRAFTALIGAATVWLVWRVGERYFGRAAGLCGALFLSVSALHATHSHIAITDVPHTLWIVAALLPLHSVLTRGRRRDYAATGLLIGLGIATKYLAGILLVALVLAHVLRLRETRAPWNEGMGALLVACAATGAGFFVGAPYCFMDAGTFVADVREQAALSRGGVGNSVVFFLGEVLPADLGWPLLLAAAVGLVLLARTPRPAHLVFLAFPLLYFLFVARYPKAFGRYMIPEDPFLALMAGVALARLHEILVRRLDGRAAAVAVAALAVALAAAPLATNLRWNRMVSGSDDPRTRARLWAETHLPAETPVAVQSVFDRTYHNAPLRTDRRRDALLAGLPGGDRFVAVRTRVRARYARRPVYREVPFVHDCDRLQAEGARYLFATSLSESLSGTFVHQLERADVVVRFAPDPAILAGIPGGEILPLTPPTITVYRLSP